MGVVRYTIVMVPLILIFVNVELVWNMNNIFADMVEADNYVNTMPFGATNNW